MQSDSEQVEAKPYLISVQIAGVELVCESYIATHEQIKSAPGILWAVNEGTNNTNPTRSIYRIHFDPLYPSIADARAALEKWLDSRIANS